MEETIKIAYAEVFEILGHMDRKIILKTPVDVIEYIKMNKKENYISRIDKKDIFNKNNIERKTLPILAWMNINYWEDEEKQKELINQYRDNDIKTEIRIKEEYKDVQLFPCKNNEEKFNQIALIEKTSFIKRIINKIYKFFKKN